MQTRPPRTAAVISSTIPVENLAITGPIQGGFGEDFQTANTTDVFDCDQSRKPSNY